MFWPLKLLLTWGLIFFSIGYIYLTIKFADKFNFLEFLLCFFWIATLVPAVIQFTLHFTLTPSKIESFIVFAIINSVVTLFLGAISFFMLRILLEGWPNH